MDETIYVTQDQQSVVPENSIGIEIIELVGVVPPQNSARVGFVELNAELL